MTDTAIYQQAFDMVRGALEEAKKKLQEIDASQALQAGQAVSEKASQYLSAAIDRANNALGELNHVMEQIKANPKDLPAQTLSQALSSAHAAFTLMYDFAWQYDEKYQLSSRVSSSVNLPKQQALAALATMGAYAAHASEAANAQLQGVSHGLRAKLAEAASAGLDKALPPVAKADEMFHVSEAAAATVAMVKKTAKELDEKFGVSGYISQAAGQAQSLDQKYTGGIIDRTVASGVTMGKAMVSSVQEKYEEAKKELTKPASSGGSA